MHYKLQLTVKFEKVLSNIDYTQSILLNRGIVSKESIEKIIKFHIFKEIKNCDNCSLEYVDTPNGYERSVTYGGAVIDENNRLIAYVFTTTIDKDSRSAYISQQIGGTVSDIIIKTIDDELVMISDIPLYILDIDATQFTDQKYFFIECALECNLNVINIFNRDYELYSKNIGVYDKNITIEIHDKIIKTLDHNGKNNYYDIDIYNKKIKLLPTRLKHDGMTNEVYYYSHRVLAAIILAKKSEYEILTDSFETYFTSRNKNIEALLLFAKKMNNIIDLNNPNIKINVTRNTQVYDTRPFNKNRRIRNFIGAEARDKVEYEDYSANPGKIREASLRHEKLIDKVVLMLKESIDLPIFESLIDLYYIDEENHRIVMYEMKTINDKNWKKQIRTAIGQILEYEFFNFAVKYIGYEVEKIIVIDNSIHTLEWENWLVFLKELKIEILHMEID